MGKLSDLFGDREEDKKDKPSSLSALFPTEPDEIVPQPVVKEEEPVDPEPVRPAIETASDAILLAKEEGPIKPEPSPDAKFFSARTAKKSTQALGQGIANLSLGLAMAAENRDIENWLAHGSDFWDMSDIEFKEQVVDPAYAESARTGVPAGDLIERNRKQVAITRAINASKNLKEFADMFPPIDETTSGEWEDALVGVLQFAPSMAITALNPASGMQATIAMIAGPKYEEYRNMGLSKEQAFELAFTVGAASGVVETAGNIAQISLLKGLFKNKGLVKLGKIGPKLQSYIEATVLSPLIEGQEEVTQFKLEQYLDLYARMPNADQETLDTVAKEMSEHEDFNKAESLSRRLGQKGGFLVGGVSAQVKGAWDLANWLESRKISANADAKAPAATPEELANRDTEIDIKDQQDLKINTPGDVHSEHTVTQQERGKLLIKLNALNEMKKQTAEESGTPASQEVTKVEALLDDEQSVSVQDRNVGGQTQKQDQATLSDNDAQNNLKNESAGQMGVVVNSQQADNIITNDEQLNFEFENAIENDDLDTARQVAGMQAVDLGALEQAYNGIVDANTQKAKGQNADVNPDIQSALDSDLNYRRERAEKNQTLAQNLIVEQAQEQNQQLINSLDDPELHRDIIWNEHIQQKNRGNSEGAKMYDRVLKEVNLKENKGNLDYLDTVNINKLSDLITDLKSYARELTPGSREATIMEKTIGRMEDQITEKREWDVLKGRQEIQDERSEDQAKAAEKAVKAPEKAKPVTAPKAKKAPAPKKPVSKLAEIVAKKREAKKIAEKQKPKPAKTALELRRRAEKIRKRETEEARRAKLAKEAKAPLKVADRLAKKAGARADALGEKGTTVPPGMVQVTMTEGPAAKATFTVPRKSLAAEIKKAEQKFITAREKIKKPKKPISPPGAVNVFRFSDGSELTGATSGEIFGKASPVQKAEMEKGIAIEGFKEPGKPFRVRAKEVKIADLQKLDRTFGILTAENPAGKVATKDANAIANRRLLKELGDLGYPVTEVKGQFGISENSFVVEGITQAELQKLGQKYGQESVIHLEDKTAKYIEGNKVVDSVDRSSIRNAPEATDFFTRLPDGTKLQIPFFEEMVKQMAAEGNIVDLDSLQAQGFDLVSIIETVARHVKMGPRRWLHKLAKQAGVKYHFVFGPKSLERNEDFVKIGPKNRERILSRFDDALGIFAGNVEGMPNAIYINIESVLRDLSDIKRVREVVDHEALHSVVANVYGKSSSKARQTIRNNLRSLWDSIPKEMREVKYNKDTNTYTVGNLENISQTDLKSLLAGFRQIDKSIDELVTFAFTNPLVANYLHSMESTQDFGKVRIRTMWAELKNIIVNHILKRKSKLDDVHTILDEILFQEGKVVRFAKVKRKAGRGMKRSAVAVSVKSLNDQAPSAAAAEVVQSTDELPAHLQSETEGIIVESVYDTKTDTAYFVADSLRDEAHLLKKWMHENVAHKGLRSLFPDRPKLERFMVEAYGLAFKDPQSKTQLLDIIDTYFGGKDLTELSRLEKQEAAEEWIAKYYAEGMKPTVKRNLLQRFADFLRKFVPARFLDVKQPKSGIILSLEDISTVLEASKAKIFGKNKKLAKMVSDAYTARAPRIPSSITDKTFLRTPKQYAQLALEVMKKAPQAKHWYNAHLKSLESIFGRDTILFNMLLAVTSPQARVGGSNEAHAAKTYAYLMGEELEAGGLFKNAVMEKVDAWKDEDSIISNISQQWKVAEFIRGLLGDDQATVLDVWMYRLMFGLDKKAPGKESFTPKEYAAGRQMIFEVSKELESMTGKVWHPRDVQAILWTWVYSKQTGTPMNQVPTYETGLNRKSNQLGGLTPIEYLDEKIGLDNVKNGPLSQSLNIEGFVPSKISRAEKLISLNVARDKSQAKVSPVTPIKGKGIDFERYENEDGSAWVEVDGRWFDFGFDPKLHPRVGSELVLKALTREGVEVFVDKNDAAKLEAVRAIPEMIEEEVNGDIRFEMEPWVIDAHRTPAGRVSIKDLRAGLAGASTDIVPKREHRYSIAKIDFQDSAQHNQRAVFEPDDTNSFLHKLFEWKDQADLNIQRSIQSLEQDFLKRFGGRKLRGIPGTTSKLLANTPKTRLLQKAMNLWIDSGELSNNFKKVLGHKKMLEKKKKLTNIERDRLAIINRMLEMTEAEKQWAAEEIKSWYDNMYEYAKDRDILDTYVDGYVRRAWKVPKDHDVIGAANSEQTAGSFSNFAITTPRGKKRQFSSIIDGWDQGLDWKLKNDAVLTNLSTYMNEINEVSANRRFINYMKEMVDTDGDSVIMDNLTDKDAREKGMVKLNARGFAKPFQTVWARKDIASAINKVTEGGLSDLWSIPGLKGIQKMNAWVKGTILSLSAFHHFAGVRSWSFGVKKGLKLNAIKAYKDGLKKIEERTETDPGGYKLGPIADFLIRNGLTIGRVQDWDQTLLAGENSVIEGILSKRKSSISRGLLAIKRAARHGREQWTRSLFNRLFAGLKVEAASIELSHAISVAEKQKGEALTDKELKAEAQKIARLINADFGGLHLKRMGRNPNAQKLAQLLLLAPDWTESNFRTITGMVPGMNTFINRMIGDFKAPAGMGSVYRKFWFGIGMRMLTAYTLAYAATYAISDDEDRKKIEELLKVSFTDYEHFKKARWTMIPLDPWLNRVREEKKRDKWLGFKLGGHFFDILKVLEPAKLLKHKASPMIRTATNLGTGTDWRGAPYTSVAELMATGQIVSENTFEKERDFFSRLPSWALYEGRSALPIWAQESLRLMQGETVALEAMRAGGVDIRPMPLPNLAKDEYTEIKSEISSIERDLKDARKVRDAEALALAKQRAADFRYNYNRTKSRLGFAKKRLSKVNAKIRILETKQRLGKELSKLEQQKLRDLEARKQAIIEQFLKVVKGSK